LTPIDCTLELIEKYRIRAADVDRVNIHTYGLALSTEIADPKTGKDAGFNAPFLLSVLLLEGSLPPEIFLDDKKVKDEKVQEFMKKVHTQIDPESDKYYPQKRRVTVEILTKDGKVYSQRRDGFKGEPDWPLDRKDISAKFMNFASKTLGKRRAEKVIDFVFRLDEKDSIQELFMLLSRMDPAC
jgi:2-methylcitrate dehydratase PrpD